jgi:hypothetical protein
MLGVCDKWIEFWWYDYFSRPPCTALFTAYKYYLDIPTSFQFPDELAGVTSAYFLTLLALRFIKETVP